MRLTKLVPGIVLIAAWQFFIAYKPSLEFFVGSPKGILKKGLELLLDGTLITATFITAGEAFVGFLIGSILGTAIGLFFWRYRWLNSLSRTYLVLLGSVPIFALGPVLVFWFGTGFWSKVVLSFFSTFILALSQAFNGASEVDQSLEKLFRVLGARADQIFRKLILPSSVVWLLAGIRLNIGFSLLAAFVGEFIASKNGLGNLIMVGQGLYDVNQIWVGVLGIMLIALVFYSTTGPVERRAMRWKGDERLGPVY